MPFLTSTLTTLVDLSLEVDDHRDSILPVIGRLSNLVRLRIYFTCDKRLSCTDLNSISGLSKSQVCLTDRQALFDTRAFLDCSWITDLYFESWIAKLTRLEFLRLRFDNATLTQASLQYIAENCPLLESCHLMWVHDLNTWRSLESPLFPTLSYLRLERVKGDNYGQDQATIDDHALRDVKMIRDLVPKLDFFEVDSNLQHETALKTIFMSGNRSAAPSFPFNKTVRASSYVFSGCLVVFRVIAGVYTLIPNVRSWKLTS